jgi:hypothetical protein
MRVVAAFTWRRPLLLLLLLGQQGGTKASVVLQKAAIKKHRKSEIKSLDGRSSGRLAMIFIGGCVL